MSEFYQAKFKELFIGFTRYVIEHPDFAVLVPQNAQAVLLDHKDPNYSLWRSSLRNKRNKLIMY